MNKKPPESDEMRMPADQFDELIRHALGASPLADQPKTEPIPKPKTVRHKQDVDA